MQRGAASAKLTRALQPKGVRPPRPGWFRGLLRVVIVLALVWAASLGTLARMAEDVKQRLDAVPDAQRAGSWSFVPAPPSASAGTPATADSFPAMSPTPVLAPGEFDWRYGTPKGNVAPTPDGASSAPTGTLPQLPSSDRMLWWTLRAVSTDPVAGGVRWTAYIGGGLMIVEAVWVLVLHWVQPAMIRRRVARRIMYRVRVPRPAAVLGQRIASKPDQDLFRAVAAALMSWGRLFGVAPWVAFTLNGKPNKPVDLGFVVTAGRTPTRSRLVRAIIDALTGLMSSVVVEEQDDPLAAATVPGAMVGWREFGLAKPAQYPLRMLDDVENSVLLGPVLAALRPRGGVVATEYQIIVRPVRGLAAWGLHRGWRGHAKALQLKLDQKNDYALANDAKTIEAKLAGVPYETTLRVVAVAQGNNAHDDVVRALNAVQDALGEYRERTSHEMQQLIPVKTIVVTVPSHAPAWSVRFAVGLVPWVLAVLAAAMLPSVAEAPGWYRALMNLIPAADIQAALLHPWTVWSCAAFVAVLGAWMLNTTIRRRTNVFSTYGIARVHGRAPQFAPPYQVFLPVPLWRAPTILSSVELGGQYHLPTPPLGPLVNWLPNRYIAAPPEAFVDAFAEWDPEKEKERVVFGRAWRSDGTLAPVGPTLKDMREVTHVTAGMGAGKSRLGANVCQQFIVFGFLLMDGKGDDVGNLTMTVRRLIPLSEEHRIIIIDLLDAAWPVGLNPLSSININDPAATSRLLGQMESIFQRIDPATWGKAQGMRDYLRNAVLLVAEGEPKPTLAHIKQVLLDEAYRAELLPRCRNIEVTQFWEVTFPEHKDAQKMSLQALLRRFNDLLTDPLTRALVSQVDSTVDFLEAIENQLIVLIPMPKQALGRLLNGTATMVFQAIIRAAFARPGDAETRRNYPILVDEAQIIVQNGDPEDVETAVTQLRSQGVPALYFHQFLGQLDEAREAIMANTGNRVMMRANGDDAAIYAKEYVSKGLSPSDITEQDPLDHQYAVFRCHGITCGPFSMKPLTWPKPLDELVTADRNCDWQALLPPDSPDASYDRVVLWLVYGEHDDWQALAQYLAETMSAHEYDMIRARWNAIRAHQRQYILDHPGCIAVDDSLVDDDLEEQGRLRRNQQRLDRQRWLSRLKYAMPRMLVTIEYARMRRTIDPATASASVLKGKPSRNDKVEIIQADGSKVMKPAASVVPQRPSFIEVDMVEEAVTKAPGEVFAVNDDSFDIDS